ncbi:hypothetical protein BHAOGJBA_4485 [Methylobacterium hispanicum]|uniref:Uncharacterized protein n=1 Tax=Methylobacterium hispanicum TaxID=270350 RepID=A0AAV4ZSZ7_9HYPH|nr:hypothetical protein [Methylobacterium hispanicum]GJD90941.1 hypothetical protein BHAOGJBA_4485 [Methylobacterium hispanicum]
MSIHVCVRVYANGEAKETVRDAEGLASWLDYNRGARPGNALFVDGVCEEGDEGYLNRAALEIVAAELASETQAGHVRTPVALSGGRYPDDRPRRSFRLRASATPAVV